MVAVSGGSIHTVPENARKFASYVTHTPFLSHYRVDRLTQSPKMPAKFASYVTSCFGSNILMSHAHEFPRPRTQLDTRQKCQEKQHYLLSVITFKKQYNRNHFCSAPCESVCTTPPPPRARSRIYICLNPLRTGRQTIPITRSLKAVKIDSFVFPSPLIRDGQQIRYYPNRITRPDIDKACDVSPVVSPNTNFAGCHTPRARPQVQQSTLVHALQASQCLSTLAIPSGSIGRMSNVKPSVEAVPRLFQAIYG